MQKWKCFHVLWKCCSSWKRCIQILNFFQKDPSDFWNGGITPWTSVSIKLWLQMAEKVERLCYGFWSPQRRIRNHLGVWILPKCHNQYVPEYQLLCTVQVTAGGVWQVLFSTVLWVCLFSIPLSTLSYDFGHTGRSSCSTVPSNTIWKFTEWGTFFASCLLQR